MAATIPSKVDTHGLTPVALAKDYSLSAFDIHSRAGARRPLQEFDRLFFTEFAGGRMEFCACCYLLCLFTCCFYVGAYWLLHIVHPPLACTSGVDGRVALGSKGDE